MRPRTKIGAQSVERSSAAKPRSAASSTVSPAKATALPALRVRCRTPRIEAQFGGPGNGQEPLLAVFAGDLQHQAMFAAEKPQGGASRTSA